MRRYFISLLCAAIFPTLSAQNYPELTVRANNQVLNSQDEALRLHWMKYQAATTVPPVEYPCLDSTKEISWIHYGHLPAVHDFEHWALFFANLTVLTPEQAGETNVLRLESKFPNPRANYRGQSLDVLSTVMRPFRPDNPNMEGFLIAPTASFGNREMRFVYVMNGGLDSDEKILIDQRKSLLSRLSMDKNEVKYEITLPLKQGHDMSLVKFGLLEVDMLPVYKDGSEYLAISAMDVGQTRYFQGIPIEILAVQGGSVHLQVPYQQMDVVTEGDWYCIRGENYRADKSLRFVMMTRPQYDFYRANAGLSPSKWLKKMEKEDLPENDPYEQRMVIVMETRSDANLFLLREPNPDARKGDMHRVVLFSRPEPGEEYRITHLNKGNDGVLRPFQEPEDEMPPVPRDGNLALRVFISRNVRYPQQAKENGEEGTVLIRVLIDEKGKPKNTEIYRGVSPSLDSEALRVVNMVKEWEPAIRDGEPVEMHIVLPITFKLH